MSVIDRGLVAVMSLLRCCPSPAGPGCTRPDTLVQQRLNGSLLPAGIRRLVPFPASATRPGTVHAYHCKLERTLNLVT